MAIENVKQIFDEMPAGFNAEGAGDWAATIQFDISGDRGGQYVVKIGDGKCEVTEGTSDDASSTIIATDETWIGVYDGSVNPMSAFMTGKLKVKGNMGDVMKLQNPAVFKRS